jgi:hypothetical protein
VRSKNGYGRAIPRFDLFALLYVEIGIARKEVEVFQTPTLILRGMHDQE